ncbi:Polycystin cation channel [Carpediemonas membranifera]|uniref:Polycystin cation channel n=1 Tax=Carpediemonas membranifera TaxID=201153 RepID=A0A8J6APY8_9EUKA|nr:Polycystin cation channel [Carpediemonas membranifera]|eukprot:KAG9390253.1 Polycystin cation channel [Carpediemonas membranifera]
MRLYFIQRRPLTAEDKFFLSPWAKWKYHGRFPWKFFTHLAIVILCMMQVMIPFQIFAEYSTAVQGMFADRFVDPVAGDGDNKEQQHFVTSIDALRTVAKTFRDTYFDINEQSLSLFDFISDGEVVSPIEVSVVMQNSSWMNIESEFTTVPLSLHWRDKTDLYPFSMDNHELIALLDNTDSIAMRFKISHVMLWEMSQRHVPYIWDVTMTVDLDHNGGRAGVMLTPEGKIDNDSWVYGLSHFPLRFMLDVSLVVTAVFSQFLAIRAIIASIQLFNLLRKRLSMSNMTERQKRRLQGLTWEDLPLRQKLRIFNLWFILSMTGNAFNVVAGLLDIASILHFAVPELLIRLAIGMGALLAFCNMLRYFEFDKNYYMLVMTLRRGAPILMQFIVSIMPIYFGFALCGVALFSQYSVKFSNFSQACVTLFAILHGDVILETYDAIYLASPVISRTYLYCFITLFICGVLNVFVHIIEESYEYSRDTVFGRQSDHIQADFFEDKIFSVMLKKFNRFDRTQRYKARTGTDKKRWQRMVRSSSSSSSSSDSESTHEAMEWMHQKRQASFADSSSPSRKSFRSPVAGTRVLPGRARDAPSPGRSLQVLASHAVNDPLSDSDMDQPLLKPSTPKRQTQMPPDAFHQRVRAVQRESGVMQRGWRRLFHSKEDEDNASSFSSSVMGDSSDFSESSDISEIKDELLEHIDRRFDAIMQLLRNTEHAEIQ